MRKILRIVMLLITAISFACSGTTVQPQKPNPAYIKELEQSFEVSPSDDDKIRIAIELVRRRAQSPRYRVFLLDEADEALAAEQAAAQQWMREAGLLSNQTAAAVPVVTHVSYRTSSTIGTPQPTWEDVFRLLPQREPDARHLLPIVGLSMTAERGDAETTRRLTDALKSMNVLHSTEAALGLARMKEKPSIPEIELAAKRFNEQFRFANALTFFGDDRATALARRLLNDDELYADMVETARLQKYDPYP